MTPCHLVQISASLGVTYCRQYIPPWKWKHQDRPQFDKIYQNARRHTSKNICFHYWMLFQRNSRSDWPVWRSGEAANGPTGDGLAARPLALQFSKNAKSGSSVSTGTAPRVGLLTNCGSIWRNVFCRMCRSAAGRTQPPSELMPGG